MFRKNLTICGESPETSLKELRFLLGTPLEQRRALRRHDQRRQGHLRQETNPGPGAARVRQPESPSLSTRDCRELEAILRRDCQLFTMGRP